MPNGPDPDEIFRRLKEVLKEHTAAKLDSYVTHLKNHQRSIEGLKKAVFGTDTKESLATRVALLERECASMMKASDKKGAFTAMVLLALVSAAFAAASHLLH